MVQGVENQTLPRTRTLETVVNNSSKWPLSICDMKFYTFHFRSSIPQVQFNKEKLTEQLNVELLIYKVITA
jgi:hypothetical protein